MHATPIIITMVGTTRNFSRPLDSVLDTEQLVAYAQLIDVQDLWLLYLNSLVRDCKLGRRFAEFHLDRLEDSCNCWEITLSILIEQRGGNVYKGVSIWGKVESSS
jgi:hypothetical protein